MQTAFISALSNAVYYIAIVYNIDRNLVIYMSISTELKSLNIMIIIYYNGGTMSKVFEAKVRTVGTSLGILIPKEIVKQEKIKKNQNIKMVVMTEKDTKLIEKTFGIDRGTKPFDREHIDRELK